MAGRRRLEDHSDDAQKAHTVDYTDTSDLQADLENEESAINAEFGEADGNVNMHFHVRKQLPNSRKSAHCFEGTAHDLPVIPRIQREFGEGNYEVWIFKNSKLSKKIQLSVLVPRVTAIAPPTTENPAMEKLLALLERRLDAPQQTQQPMNMLEMLTAGAAFITAATPIIQTVIGKNSGNSMKDTLEMLATAKELFGGETDTREKGFLDVASDLLKSPLLAAMTQQGAPQNPPRPALPSPEGPTPEQLQQAQLAQLQAQLAHLVTRAMKNSPPDLYAEVIEDSLPPEFVQMLQSPGALEYLGQIHPPVLTYRPWFEALLRELANGAMDETGGADEQVTGAASVSPQSPPRVPIGDDPRWTERGTGDAEGNGEEIEGGAR